MHHPVNNVGGDNNSKQNRIRRLLLRAIDDLVKSSEKWKVINYLLKAKDESQRTFLVGNKRTHLLQKEGQESWESGPGLKQNCETIPMKGNFANPESLICQGQGMIWERDVGRGHLLICIYILINCKCPDSPEFSGSKNASQTSLLTVSVLFPIPDLWLKKNKDLFLEKLTHETHKHSGFTSPFLLVTRPRIGKL